MDGWMDGCFAAGKVLMATVIWGGPGCITFAGETIDSFLFGRSVPAQAPGCKDARTCRWAMRFEAAKILFVWRF